MQLAENSSNKFLEGGGGSEKEHSPHTSSRTCTVCILHACIHNFVRSPSLFVVV